MGKEESKQGLKQKGEEVLRKLAKIEHELNEIKKCINVGLFKKDRTPDQKKYKAWETAQIEISSMNNSLNDYKMGLYILGIPYCLDYNIRLTQDDYNKVCGVEHKNRSARKIVQNNIEAVLRELDQLKREVLQRNCNVDSIDINAEKEDEGAELNELIKAYIYTVYRTVEVLNINTPLSEIEKQVKMELLKFMLYLSLSYSRISEAQLKCIEELLGIEISLQKVDSIIEEDCIDTPDFVRTVPLSYQLLLKGYKNMIEIRPDLASTQAFGATIFTYFKIGEVFLAVDETKNDEAEEKCEIYIDMLKRFLIEN